MSAHTFTAWRHAGGNALCVAVERTLADAISEAMPYLNHKETLLVHEVHAGRREGFLHAYRVRKGKAEYRRNPDTGLTERFEPLKLDALFSLPVDAFEPTLAFDAFRDDPVGIDRTLVEG